MTHVSNEVAPQMSKFNGIVVGLFTTAIVVLAGVLTVATFAAV